MRLEHYSTAKLRSQVLEIVGRYLDLNEYKVFFFGSRVRGTNSPLSDIDIGIDGPAPIPGEVRVKIADELDELPTLYSFDVVDFKTVAEDFKRKTLQEVEHVN
ncbi:MAG: nucleotidyltransferase domain-containing protein [Candidatus Aminicenantes bacterium]|jgi:predicted nucleotidyltransferase|nr:nucleotidyltransferase domain-containing protein [Candidatus Aminicenantes bacterium]